MKIEQRRRRALQTTAPILILSAASNPTSTSVLWYFHLKCYFTRLGIIDLVLEPVIGISHRIKRPNDQVDVPYSLFGCSLEIEDAVRADINLFMRSRRLST